VLAIGDIEIVVEAIDLRPNLRTRSPFWALLPIPAIALAVLAFTRSSTAAEAQIPPAPELFDAPVSTCPLPPSPMLGAYAAERARIGNAKRERSPFSRGDGIEAVTLLEVAAACHHAAGQADAEREARSTAQALRSKLEEEYRVRRVRVEHAVRVGDVHGAKRELAVLVPLTAHRHGPYVDWLASMDRYATATIDQRAGRRL
jgi:hypothetical protein